MGNRKLKEWQQSSQRQVVVAALEFAPAVAARPAQRSRSLGRGCELLGPEH